jgi:hypothetical protein
MRFLTPGCVLLALAVLACSTPESRGPSAGSANGDSATTNSAAPFERAAMDTLWLLASNPAGDAIHSTDDEAELVRRYGAANVWRDSIALGEGENTLGTLLFRDDTLRRLEIMWQDTAAFRRPARVRISTEQTRWAAAPGVSLRTTLAELERLNGRPFTLLGFGWDYAGTVVDWEHGRLDSLWHTKGDPEALVGVRLAPTASVDDSIAMKTLGDKPYKSNDPNIVALKPVVTDLWIHPR